MPHEDAKSAAAWIRAQRVTGLSLHQLQAQLRTQFDTHGKSLLSMVASELPHLVDISTSVNKTSAHIKHLSKRLQTHRTVASEIGERMSIRQIEISAAFDERALLLCHADELRLVWRLAESLRSLESLVETASEGGKYDDALLASLDETASRLLRASGECSRLLLLRKRASKLPTVGRQLERFAAARSALLLQLSKCLRHTLIMAEAATSSGGGGLDGDIRGDGSGGDDSGSTACDGPATDADAVGVLLSAFAEAGGEDEAARWVRTQWVAPRLVPQLVQAATAPDAGLTELATALVAFVEGPSFAPLARADMAAARPLHLLCAAPWAEWCQFVGRQLQHAFGAGMPDTFHAAYLALHALLDRLTEPLPSNLARHLRLSPTTTATQRRFNLLVYFQIRQQELIKKLEAAFVGSTTAVALTSDKPPLPTSDGSIARDGAAEAVEQPREATRLAFPDAPALRTVPMATLVDALRRALDASVFLRPLASRLVRLLLQCLSRATTWLDGIVSYVGGAGGAGSLSGAGNLGGASGVGGASGAGMGGAGVGEAVAVALVAGDCEESGSGLLELYFDLHEIDGWITFHLVPAISELLGLDAAGSDASLATECDAAIGEGVAALKMSAQRLRAELVNEYVTQCTAHLAPVRAIAATYRMTGKTMPTQPSFFVTEVLKPLRALTRFRAPQTCTDAFCLAPAFSCSHATCGGGTDAELNAHSLHARVLSLSTRLLEQMPSSRRARTSCRWPRAPHGHTLLRRQ